MTQSARRASSTRRRTAAALAAAMAALVALLSPAPAQAAPGQVTVHFYEGSADHESWTHVFGPKFTMWINVYGCGRDGSVKWFVYDPTKQTPPPPGGVGLLKPWWSNPTNPVGNGVYSKYSAATQHIKYEIDTSYGCKYRIRVTEYRANVPS
jgi:hypothetical protein